MFVLFSAQWVVLERAFQGKTKVTGTFHSDKQKGQVGMRKEVMTVQTVAAFHFSPASRISVINK